jgi:hypothetical protein
MANNITYTKEDIASIIAKSFLITSLAKWLTRESCTQDVKFGNTRNIDLHDVA